MLLFILKTKTLTKVSIFKVTCINKLPSTRAEDQGTVLPVDETNRRSQNSCDHETISAFAQETAAGQQHIKDETL